METPPEWHDQVCVASSPFGGIPRNWKQHIQVVLQVRGYKVPPSGGSLEIGNRTGYRHSSACTRISSSPFGGIPRNWKPAKLGVVHGLVTSSPFGGIPRNWKLEDERGYRYFALICSPFGGIPRNWKRTDRNTVRLIDEIEFPLRGDP